VLKLSLAHIAFAAVLALAPVALVGCAGDTMAGESDGQRHRRAPAAGKFEIFQGADGKYYFHLLAGTTRRSSSRRATRPSRSATSGITSVRATART